MAIILEKSCDGAAAVARGVSRLFLRNQIFVQSEVSLRNNRRADLMGVNAKGEVVIVEIKCSRADLLGDQKWPEYLDYCDRFFWAVPADFDFSPIESAWTLRIVPSSAFAGFVAPITSRFFAMAFSPSKT